MISFHNNNHFINNYNMLAMSFAAAAVRIIQRAFAIAPCAVRRRPLKSKTGSFGAAAFCRKF